MSSDGLVTISDRGSSFGDLNAVHPVSRYIVQAECGGQTTEIGDNFGHHLGINAAQAEQLDLFGARDGIAVVHIHRSVVLKTSCKGATGRALQVLGGDFLNSHRLDRVDIGGFLSRCNLHLVEHVYSIENVIVMRRLHHVVNGVVLVADAAEYEATDALMKWDFIVSVGIGHRAFVDDFPIYIHARKRSTLTVFGLFVNGAFDEALGKSA